MALEDITPATRLEEFIDRVARAAASPNLPQVDASDNGDVLTVVSGEWAAAAPAGGLPEVTSSNNGQVLTVVSGEWAAANPSGGGAYIVNVSNDGTSTLDKTWNEIWTAAASGPVFLKVSTESEVDYDFVGSVLSDLSDPENPYYGVRESVTNNFFSTTSANGYPVLEATTP